MRAMEEGADLSSLRAAVRLAKHFPLLFTMSGSRRLVNLCSMASGRPSFCISSFPIVLMIIVLGAPKPVKGYEAKIIGDNGQEVATGSWPTGCSWTNWLSISSWSTREEYVQDGWNISGDFWKDDEGYFHFAARNDDIIVSSGYNIAGPDVEAALLSHDDVVECAVIGIPDPERGSIVQAHVVLLEQCERNDEKVKALQDHVKAMIAPYKYPRSIIFTEDLQKPEWQNTALQIETGLRGIVGALTSDLNQICAWHNL